MKHRTSLRIRQVALLVFLAAGLMGTFLIADGKERGRAPLGPHGAATMEYQKSALEGLIGDVDVTQPPQGLDPVVWEAFIPKTNKMTPERVELGRELYFDVRLSRDGTVACATCHDVTRGFSDQRKVSEGIRGQLGRRNSPTTLNVALLQTLFLDGRSSSLEHQARMPLINPIEMGMHDHEAVEQAVKKIPEYRNRFKKAYGREVNIEDIGQAIAAFERILIFMESPFMHFLRGDPAAISRDAKKGWDLFNGKARCVTCHHINPSNPLGTDNRFHNIGVSARHQDFEVLARRALKALARDPSEQSLDQLALGTDMSELGRFMVTKNRSDIGAFRTSLLLNVGITPPYMHDGSMNTLWDVMDHYNKGGEANPFLDGGMEPLALTESEVDQIVAFLFSLTDSRFAEENKNQFAEQKARAEKERPFRDQDLAFRRTLVFEKRVFGPQGFQK